MYWQSDASNHRHETICYPWVGGRTHGSRMVGDTLSLRDPPSTYEGRTNSCIMLMSKSVSRVTLSVSTLNFLSLPRETSAQTHKEHSSLLLKKDKEATWPTGCWFGKTVNEPRIYRARALLNAWSDWHIISRGAWYEDMRRSSVPFTCLASFILTLSFT